jgi:hypothetical protein
VLSDTSTDVRFRVEATSLLGLLAQVETVLAGWAHDLQTLTRRMVSPEIGLLELLVPAARYGVQ